MKRVSKVIFAMLLATILLFTGFARVNVVAQTISTAVTQPTGTDPGISESLPPSFTEASRTTDPTTPSSSSSDESSSASTVTPTTEESSSSTDSSSEATEPSETTTLATSTEPDETIVSGEEVDLDAPATGEFPPYLFVSLGLLMLTLAVISLIKGKAGLKKH